jgi:hypothetical protein
MKTLFESVARAALLSRLDRLTPDAERRFGTMSPGQMLSHLQDSLGVALGRVESKPAPILMANPFTRWLAICVIPWPKGKLDSPKNQLQSSPGEFATDRDRLKASIVEFADRGAEGAFGTHEYFGDMPGLRWGQLLHRHVDYHLKQFGV